MMILTHMHIHSNFKTVFLSLFFLSLFLFFKNLHVSLQVSTVDSGYIVKIINKAFFLWFKENVQEIIQILVSFFFPLLFLAYD